MSIGPIDAGAHFIDTLYGPPVKSDYRQGFEDGWKMALALHGVPDEIGATLPASPGSREGETDGKE